MPQFLPLCSSCIFDKILSANGPLIRIVEIFRMRSCPKCQVILNINCICSKEIKWQNLIYTKEKITS